jgi:hypothetical protein
MLLLTTKNVIVNFTKIDVYFVQTVEVPSNPYLNVVRGVDVQEGEDHGELAAVGMPDLVGALLVVRVVGVAERGRGQGAVVAVQDSVAT